MRSNLLLSLIVVMGLSEAVCHSDSVVHGRLQQFETQVQLALNAFFSQVTAGTFSERSDLFFSPPSKETADTLLSSVYLVKGLLPGSSFQCREIRSWSLSKLEIDYEQARAKARVEVECVTNDKGYVTNKEFNFQKEGGSWFLSVPSK